MKNIRSGIVAIDKLTLLDYPGHISAIIFLQGCNLACPFCHNSELISDCQETDQYDAAIGYLKKRIGVLNGVVITGGEPSLYDLDPLLSDCKSMGYQVKVDTNGLKPAVIQHWIDSQLVDYIAMDIKNSPCKYAMTCGVSHLNFSDIQKSIDIIMSSDIEYEFRTTVLDPIHAVEDIEEIAKIIIPDADQYYLQPFVLRESVPNQTLGEPSDDLMISCRDAAQQYVKHVGIRGRDL